MKAADVTRDQAPLSASWLVGLTVQNWRRILASVMAAWLLGVIYYSLAPREFEASALLSGARLDRADGTMEMSALLRRPALFPVQILTTCGYERTDADALMHLATQRLTASPVRGTGLLALSTTGASRDQAMACLSKVIETILDQQKAAFAPAIDKLIVEQKGHEQQIAYVTGEKTRSIEQRKRAIDFERQMLARQVSNRDEYFANLRTERQSKQAHYKTLEAYAASINEMARPRTANDEYAATSLVLSTRSSLADRLQQVSDRLKEIDALIERNVAPNDIEIKNAEQRIREAEIALASGDTLFNQQLLKLTLELAQMKAEYDIQSARLPRVVTAPFASSAPFSPRRSSLAVLSTTVGLMAGLALVLLPALWTVLVARLGT